MGLSRNFGAISLILALLFAAPLARAADPAASTGPPLTAGPVITDTAVPLATGHFSIQPYVFLNFTAGQFTSSWRRVSAGGDFVSLSMPNRLTIGPAPNVEVYLVLPYQHNWAARVDQPGPGGQRAADCGGLGDISFTGKYQFWAETAYCPTVTGLFTVTFPTGHAAHLNPARLGTDLLGRGTYTFTYGFNLSKWVPPVYLYANLWYGMSTTGLVDGQPERVRDQVTVNLAAEWVLTPRWVVLGELFSIWEPGVLLGGTANLAPSRSRLGTLCGIEYILNFNWNFTLGLATDLTARNTPWTITPVFTLTYTY